MGEIGDCAGASVTMAYSMGMAGSRGMLRRMIYENGLYQPYLAVALVGALLIAVGFVVFLANIVSTLGWANALSLVVPERWLKPRPDLAEA